MLREGTAPGISADRTLCSNHWVVIGASLQSNLDHWLIFQELWDGILEGKKSKFRKSRSSHKCSNADAKF